MPCSEQLNHSLKKNNSLSIIGQIPQFWLWANILLALAVIVLLVVYVMMTNALVAKKFSLDDMYRRLSVLYEDSGTLAASRSEIDASLAISKFAQNSNMVEISDADYYFGAGDVAIQK